MLVVKGNFHVVELCNTAGTTLLVCDTATFDIREQLKKIGVEKLSPEARIAYNGRYRWDDGIKKLREFFITDAGAKGILALFITPDAFRGDTNWFNGYATSLAPENEVDIPTAFSFATAGWYSPVVAVLCDLQLTVFASLSSKEQTRVISIDLKDPIPEQNPINPKFRVVCVVNPRNPFAEDIIHIPITADNFKNIYVFNYTEYKKENKIEIWSFSK
ncbi:MAG: hypothetical protein AB1468_02245 [Candidatus Micrarchaeota archaeon]